MPKTVFPIQITIMSTAFKQRSHNEKSTNTQNAEIQIYAIMACNAYRHFEASPMPRETLKMLVAVSDPNTESLKEL